MVCWLKGYKHILEIIFPHLKAPLSSSFQGYCWEVHCSSDCLVLIGDLLFLELSGSSLYHRCSGMVSVCLRARYFAGIKFTISINTNILFYIGVFEFILWKMQNYLLPLKCSSTPSVSLFLWVPFFLFWLLSFISEIFFKHLSISQFLAVICELLKCCGSLWTHSGTRRPGGFTLGGRLEGLGLWLPQPAGSVCGSSCDMFHPGDGWEDGPVTASVLVTQEERGLGGETGVLCCFRARGLARPLLCLTPPVASLCQHSHLWEAVQEGGWPAVRACFPGILSPSFQTYLTPLIAELFWDSVA